MKRSLHAVVQRLSEGEHFIPVLSGDVGAYTAGLVCPVIHNTDG